MRLVVDSNILIAGLLRDGITRSLLMQAPIEFLSPEHMLGELRKHRRAIAKRASLSEAEHDLLLALIADRVTVVESKTYAPRLPEALDTIGGRDPGDAPFLALALYAECGIWTYNEKHFTGAGVRIWTTPEVAAWTRSSPAA